MIMWDWLLLMAGNSLTSSGDRSSVAGGSVKAIHPPVYSRLAMKKEPIDAMEFPFLTMSKFPSGFIVNIGKYAINHAKRTRL